MPQDKLKLNVRQTLLIGLGFFASSLLWSLYNSFVPLILQDFIASTATVGLIMTIDNVFGVIFQPYFGARSDKTRTRFGRRMPYILIGAPICAVLFAFIPQMKVLWLLMLVIIIFNFIMSIWRAPMIALMPDLTLDPLRSKANGLINLMRAALPPSSPFWWGTHRPQPAGRGATFLMGSVIMLLAVGLLFVLIKENRLNPRLMTPPDTQEESGDQSFFDWGLPQAVVRFPAQPVLSASGDFFWFCAYNAVETFFTSYATTVLGQSEGQAAMLLAFFSVSFVIFAVPRGSLPIGSAGAERSSWV
ncbi:MFS transporter [Proteiniclasticum sp. QWL-01]|uniref:MFS transporter n=1 Tax=Proteiniclasticum sp. QWL-01 TaxID=3036945 RepID=UPI0024104D27|nr:MFS transporter [Proteiniclasticum sp. QWL-01]WFF72904.1 MFS transporter [Proteiniclasticum sp. QWL-01]